MSKYDNYEPALLSTEEVPLNNLPIVGMRFRPPADTIIAGLPNGIALLLVREPENQYDANAVQVLLPAGWQANIDPAVLRDISENVSLTGNTMPEADVNYMLGYIPKGLAEQLAPIMDNAAEDLDAKLGFLPNGQPCAVLEDSEDMGVEDEEELEEIEDPIEKDD